MPISWSASGEFILANLSGRVPLDRATVLPANYFYLHDFHSKSISTAITAPDVRELQNLFKRFRRKWLYAVGIHTAGTSTQARFFDLHASTFSPLFPVHLDAMPKLFSLFILKSARFIWGAIQPLLPALLRLFFTDGKINWSKAFLSVFFVSSNFDSEVDWAVFSRTTDRA